jgi:hypothetical protein
MKLKLGQTTRVSADFDMDGGGSHVITIHCADVIDDAPIVARSVNLFPALVSALVPFRSNEMGDMLIGLIDTREANGEAAQKNLTRLVNMIDVILDAAEASDLEDTDAG